MEFGFFFLLARAWSAPDLPNGKKPWSVRWRRLPRRGLVAPRQPFLFAHVSVAEEDSAACRPLVLVADDTAECHECIVVQWGMEVPRAPASRRIRHRRALGSHASTAERYRDPHRTGRADGGVRCRQRPSMGKCTSSLVHHWLLVDDVSPVNVLASVSLADQPRGGPRAR
jgi:hypothetical protein